MRFPKSFLWVATAASMLLLRISAAPQEPSLPEPSSASLITGLPGFWQDGLRDQVRPIRLEMIVSFYDGAWNNLWAEVDGEAGYFKCAGSLPIQSRDRVLVEGTVIPRKGLSADTARFTILERNVDIASLPVDGKLSLYSQLRARLVSFDATFDRMAISDGNHLVMDFIAEGIRIHAFHWAPNPQLLDIKPGSRMRITGVYVANQDPLTEKMEIDIWCARLEDFVLIGPPETDPRFKSPVDPIERLPSLYAARAANAHIAGTVRTHDPGHSVVIRDETGAVRVQTLQTFPLKAGDWIEAIGTPVTGGVDWSLRDALIRHASPSVVAERKKAAAEAPSTLRTIDQILALTAQEAAAAHPVDITGIILWSHPEALFLYVSDTSGSVRMRLPEKMGSQPYKPRSQVRIHGVTEMGAFAPELRPIRMEQIATALFPEAKPLTLDQAMTGMEEGRLVSMRGYVQRAVSDGPWSRMTLSTQTGTFDVLMSGDEKLESLAGAIISVRGVCSAITNNRRQLVRVELLALYSDDLRVEQSALSDPFSAPLREISALRQFNLSGPLDFWVRVRGVVTQHVPGRYAIIQDGSEGLMLLTEQKDPLSSGDFVEVTGLPGYENGRVVLREAIYRKTARAQEPAAVEVRDVTKFAEELDSCLVRLRGTLLNRTQDGQNVTLEIESGPRVFRAVLHNASAAAQPNLQPGSTLELIGVYQLVLDERHKPQGFRLQLRTPADIRILQKPSWWTPARAFAVTGLLLGCIALALTWLSVLRRRVKQQTDQIRTQILKEAKLEAQTRAIVANANDCIFTTDLAGNFTSFNPAGERLLGYTPDEILKLNLRDLVARDEARATPELIAALAENGQAAARFELRMRARDGRLIWTEINACLVRTEGALDGVLGVARDIGERKEIEDELKRARDAAQANTEAKSAFLANMSHEIRTPMNGVIGMSNLILDTKLTTDQREYAETIRNSAESLLTVLNDILDFSKIEAGKLHFEMLDFDLVRSAEECLELLNARAAEKQIELSLFAPPGLSRLVKGDQGRLRQVLVNLAGNAIKFTDRGEVAVTLSVDEENTTHLLIRFEVSDTGVGISAENINKLFQPFSQGDVSTTRRFGGTGLGLVICKQIVQLMHGSIGVTSTLGQGSTFWFTVRLEKQPVDSGKSSGKSQNKFPAARMLVVDDHAQNRRIASTHASHWGLRCHTASSIGDALLAVNEALENDDPYRLILFDCQLPDAEFPAFAATLHTDPRNDNTALLALTLVDRRISEDDATRFKIDAVITKPLSQDELHDAVAKTLQREHGQSTPAKTITKPPSTSPLTATGQIRILVAEDNTVNQRVILLQLKKLGCHADLASNGLEVIQALERKPYDIVFMDCHMPEMDGYEATRVIRKDPRFAKLRIIAMTANAMQGDRDDCIAAGMDDYLSKPTRMDDLAQTLAAAGNGQSPSPA